METVPERIDWLWFLSYTLESPIPDHSVLSKARARWGKEVFKDFFERIVIQCVEKGLVDGTKIFMDASLIDANASNNSVIDTRSIKKYLHQGYRELEKRLQEKESEVNTAIFPLPIQALRLSVVQEEGPCFNTKHTGQLMPSTKLLRLLK